MKIFLSGITGQCGSVAARHFITKGYEVYGLVRRTSAINTLRLTDILDQITLIPGDLTDQVSLIKAIETANPDIVINLASQSFVKVSWDIPVLTADVTGIGTLRMLEAVRIFNPKIKFIQASSSECYGLVEDGKSLNEKSKFYCRSPYACAKAFAHHITINYRESYGMHASCATLFNYESEWRSPEFVTRKITMAAARIKLGKQKELRLGNIQSKRDWTYCLDSVKALDLMSQQENPDDYIIASEMAHSIVEFCEATFDYLDLNYKDYVVIDESLFRPAEVPFLLGDSSKIRTLGWKPEIPFEKIVQIMVDKDIERVKNNDVF